jgi:hypothetical protein
MSRELLDKWHKAATELVEVRASFSPPIRVILGEAVDVARFTQAYWEPVKDTAGKILRPGLALAGVKLPTTIGAEILELQDALQTAQTDYLLTVAPAQPDVRARGEFVLAEISAAIEWLLDDGVEDDRDKQLAALKSEYSDGSASTDTLAAELSDYAELAQREAVGLDGLGGFDLSLIGEAAELARQLRERPTTPAPAENARRALDLRNRVATLLVDRIATVRAAARFIFRNQPEIARQVGSAYVRRKRASARRSAAKPASTNAATNTATASTVAQS